MQLGYYTGLTRNLSGILPDSLLYYAYEIVEWGWEEWENRAIVESSGIWIVLSCPAVRDVPVRCIGEAESVAGGIYGHSKFDATGQKGVNWMQNHIIFTRIIGSSRLADLGVPNCQLRTSRKAPVARFVPIRSMRHCNLWFGVQRTLTSYNYLWYLCKYARFGVLRSPMNRL